MGSEFKLSLHEPREKKPARAHISVTEDTQAEVRLADRFLNVWPRAANSDALENEFHLIFPTSELRIEGPDEDDFAGVNWLPAAPVGGALEVLFVSGPSSENDNLKAANGENVLATLPLSPSRSCWVLRVVHAALPAELVAQIERTKAKLRTQKPTFAVGDVDFDEPGTRVQLGMARDGRPLGWIEASFIADVPAA
jgi:hypothetical protein